MFLTHLETLVYVLISFYPGVTCKYWGFAGIYVTGKIIPPDDVSMVIDKESLVTCIFQCTYNPDCFTVSYQSTELKCIGYKTTNMIGTFKPEDPDVNPPNDNISLYFNYNYANSLGFVSNLRTGTSFRVSGIRLTQAEAETECQKWNSHLITFLYLSQINELKAVIFDNPLLENEFMFVAGQGFMPDFFYPNGERIPGDLWMSGQPVGFDQCVALTKFGLAVLSCTQSLYFICSLL